MTDTRQNEEPDMIADVTVCNAAQSDHSLVLFSTAMTNPGAGLTLEPGDCYFSSNGERITLRIAHQFRVDQNLKKDRNVGPDKLSDLKLRKATDSFKVKKSTKERTVWVRVY